DGVASNNQDKMVNFGKKLKERQFPEWQRYHVPRSCGSSLISGVGRNNAFGGDGTGPFSL
ncbi:hypothetical protein SUGI_0967260, partial [Cryptomeria japonica]